MSDEDKLMRLFFYAYGVINGSCTTQIAYNDDNEPIGVNVVKGGEVCWTVSREELVFEYVTRDFS